VNVFSRSAFLPVQTVAIVGGVRKPGRVPYRHGMTIRDAVLLAGGLTDDAYLGEAEIARLARNAPAGTLATTVRVPLDSTYLFGRGYGPAGPPGQAAPAGGAPETALEAYDNVLIMRQSSWELQRSVALTGQVKFPGRYTLTTKTERLSDLIQRAGGLTTEAYAGGIRFYRPYIDGQPSRSDRLDRAGPDTLSPKPSRRDSVTRMVPERIGVDLPEVLKDPKHRDNLIMFAGDSVYIPEFDPVVMVQGAVNSPGAVAYTPGKNLDWYVDAAGGYTQRSDKSHGYVTQPNGEREGVKRKVILSDRVPKPRPGAMVYVPTKIESEQPTNVAGILATAASILVSLTTVVILATQN
jgi:protein involved in polysaccharide export with SLBB domain